MVGRKRTKDRHLPRRVYRHHGGYRYITPEGKAIYLGKTEAEMYTALADIAQGKIYTMGDVLDR